jgi:predicted N-formylglutamate amidohydrolase
LSAAPHPASILPARIEPAFEVIAGDAAGGLLFLADHASNAVPDDLHGLGLPPAELRRHIAWDIGVEPVTRALAARFGAPAVLSRFSRLVIDPNRGGDDPTLVMRIADGALVPGNARIGAEETARRHRRFYAPYDDAIGAAIEAMTAAGPPPAIVSLHSFTPEMKGRTRPWHIGVLWDCDPRLPLPFLAAARRESGLIVGDNEPYDGALVGDTLHRHATARGLANILIELRQDLIDTDEGAARWANRLEPLLRAALAAPDIHEIRHHESRAPARIRQRRG